MANYLPVLLASTTTNAISDDSSVSTLPRSQVDYLSHQWKEDDIAKSWRSMTRQKNDIANGPRLENASWRTWWKQRNKLKTVSPETLNWLKDSDVTWLYGPLHTSVDWTPPPKPKPQPTSVDDPTKSSVAGGKLDLATEPPLKRKSILKQRTISEMLISDFTSPPFTSAENDNEDGLGSALANPDRHKPARPGLPHTKSDTHVTRWRPDRPLRKDSPPRVSVPGQTDESSEIEEDLSDKANCALDTAPAAAAPPTNSLSSVVPSSEATRNRRKRARLSPSSSDEGKDSKKKHISFNTFVEQCIAIDKPKDELFSPGTYNTPWGPRKGSFSAGNWLRPGAMPKEWLDGSEDEEFGSAPIWTQLGSAIETDSESSALSSDDEDDNGIRMRPNLKSAYSSSSSSSSSSASRAQSIKPNLRAANHSSDPHHVTIAPIAPTRLKTNDDPMLPKAINWSESLGDDSAAYGDDGYVWGGVQRNPNLQRRDSDEPQTPVELVFAPPIGSGYDVKRDLEEDNSPSDPHPLPRNQGTNDLHNGPDTQAQSLPPTVVKTHVTDDLVEEDAYDYFGGPDMDIEFSRRAPVNGRTKPASAPTPASQHVDQPRSPSPRNPPSSSSAPIPVPESDSTLLSPGDGERGRSMHSSSPNGSSSSHSRGRSSTRTSSSSLSNERSSPLGSLSPDGIGSPGGAYANGRRGAGGRGDRERDRERSRGRSSSREDRGRDRTSRSLSHSRSPSIGGCSTVSSNQSLDAAVVAANKQSTTTPTAQTVAVSESQVSTPTQTTAMPTHSPSTPTTAIPPAPSPVPELPTTPANSPVVGSKLPPYIQPSPPSSSTKFPTSSPSVKGGITKSKPVIAAGLGATVVVNGHKRRASEAVVSTSTTPPSRSPPPPSVSSRLGHGSSNSIPDGTTDGVVGRAVGLVSSAGAYLGGFWSSNGVAGGPGPVVNGGGANAGGVVVPERT
ncbi:hypothetical protein DL96DRAFT_1585157 [Flagelloscypha sp. PMI_526]|nr:hypothetical protein DL96DRAFT_1585157 [Flagelloscypha sp. PMI_526]